jgi:sirohydrochlorin ferrochelatase
MSSPTPCTLLVDNGSHRATSTLNLRKIATRISAVVGHPIHPVSLLHSTKVDPADLGGEPAQILEPFLHARRAEGIDSFLILPFFFGHSAAIYEYVPQRMRELREQWPALEMRLAPCLVDLDDPGNTDVAEILASLVEKKITEEHLVRPGITLVDHGTPRIAVNLVRNFLADQLRVLLGDRYGPVAASSMERREGDAYAFNEPLLENLLGKPGFEREVVLSMLFLSPGRHAGPGGDIAQICSAAEAQTPGLATHMSDLFATHEGAIGILAKRYYQGLESAAVTEEVAPPKAVAALSG